MDHRRLLGLALLVSFASALPSSGQSFSDQTVACGIAFTTNVPTTAGRPHWPGGTVGDFNRDGWPDIFLLGGGGVADALYINNGDGTFTDRAAQWGIALEHRGRGAVAGDYNNDGWLDISITSAGDMTGGDRPGQHILYRNNGDGTFTNVAEAAGVAYTSEFLSTASAAFGDYNLDGWLDLFVATWDAFNDGNRLFRNNGDGMFTDVTVAAGIAQDMRGFVPRFADMDNDRYPELLLVSDFKTTKYYKNNQDGTFTNWTSPSGTGLEDNGMGSAVLDINRDGLQDWYTTSIYRDDLSKDGNYMYLNLGNHTFDDLPAGCGCKDGGWGWGTTALDFDHDGWTDLAETNGWSDAEFRVEPSYLYRNNGDLTFTRSELPYTAEGRSIMTLDYDRDGDMDLVIVPHNAQVAVFRNDLSGPDKHWLEVLLDTSGVGPPLAPDGIGSRVIVTAGGVTQYFYMSRGATYLGQSQLVAHFGLGAATTVDTLTVEWTDGSTTTLTNFAADQIITVSPTVFGAPGETSEPSVASQQMRARYHKATGEIEVTYHPACNATNHTIYYGDLANVSSYTYSGAACWRGNSGTTLFKPGTLDNAFFVVVGNTGIVEGSYGQNSSGVERPQDVGSLGCDLPQDLTATCVP